MRSCSCHWQRFLSWNCRLLLWHLERRVSSAFFSTLAIENSQWSSVSICKTGDSISNAVLVSIMDSPKALELECSIDSSFLIGHPAVPQMSSPLCPSVPTKPACSRRKIISMRSLELDCSFSAPRVLRRIAYISIATRYILGTATQLSKCSKNPLSI